MQRQGYPAGITDITTKLDTKNFPSRVAGYARDRVLAYTPDMKDYSVAYNIYDQNLKNAVTLYFYPGVGDIEKQFEHEKHQIVTPRPGIVAIGESTATLVKNGVIYTARVAKHRYRDVSAQQRQEVHSEPILVSLPARYFKIRSTALPAQAPVAEAKVRELLEIVDWTQ